MEGYSGKSLAGKLGVKEGMTLAAIGAPSNYRELLGPLPAGVRFSKPDRESRLIHCFATSRARLTKQLPKLRRQMADDAALWISWPKKSAGFPTDITEDVVRALALPLGLVDNKVCAVDQTWSALRLVVRLTNRQIPIRRT